MYKLTVLITGGAGYIGSHIVQYLLSKSESIVVIDNLQSGHREAIPSEYFHQIDLRHKQELDRIFNLYDIEAVIHLAANSIVGESMKNPYEYYHNNVYGTLCLLDVMKERNVRKLIFSSTAAVYGEPKQIPITEEHILNPTNAYGETKLAIEKMIKWFDFAYGIKNISLRYFNAAGAHESGSLGEDHDPETHLIPLILQVPLGKRDKIYIYGDDYPTDDGTCIRDYIHVMDLASAHYLALEHLRNGYDSDVFNLGNERGYSVREIIEVARTVTNHSIPQEITERRKGDPPILVASSAKAKHILGWIPKYNSVEKIVADAWNWYSNIPNGY